MTEPLVTFLIPFGFGLLFLRDALKSCLAQTENRWEAIVVDDHSAESPHLLASYFQDARIRFLSLPLDRSGVAASREWAIQAAQSERLITLDADDISLAHRAARVCDLLEPTVAQLIYTRIRFMNSSGVPGALKPSLEPYSLELLRLFNFITNPGTAFTRAAYERAGGWLCQQLSRSEDYELFLRMAQLNVLIQPVDEVHVLYRKHSLSLTALSFNLQHQSIMQVRQLHQLSPFPLSTLLIHASPTLAAAFKRSRRLRCLWRDDRWPRSFRERLSGW